MSDSEPNEMTPETKALFEEMQAAANKSDGSDDRVTLPPPNAKDPKDYTEEELAQYEAMMEQINKMSLKQLQAWQRRANDLKKPQKEKALAKRRKAAKAKKVQKKHMKARKQK